MLNIKQTDINEIGKTYTKNIPLAFLIGSLLLYELGKILPFTFNNVSLLEFVFNLNFLILNLNSALHNFVFITYNPNYFETNFINYLQIQQIGFSLYTYEAILLIILSIILLLAMLFPIFISKTKKK
jgi:NADH-ubiquinone oxidoreductase chain 6